MVVGVKSMREPSKIGNVEECDRYIDKAAEYLSKLLQCKIPPIYDYEAVEEWKADPVCRQAFLNGLMSLASARKQDM